MTEQAIAGWYPDGSGIERYWDGSAWTEHIRSPLPPSPVETRADDKNAGVFSKLGSAVKKAADERRSAKDEERRLHEERARAAGDLVTSGVFGTSTIEIYDGGYVRVAVGRDGMTEAAKITKTTPYEKLRSIDFAEPEASQRPEAAAASPIEGAVVQAMSGLLKGGKMLAKGTAVGAATTAIAHVAANAARKSNLVIATDKAIHTLSNQTHNGWMKVSRKEHDAVATALVEAGHAVLGMSIPASQGSDSVAAVAAPVTGTSTALANAPSLSARLRELSELHKDGILSEDEFSAAKAKLLSGL